MVPDTGNLSPVGGTADKGYKHQLLCPHEDSLVPHAALGSWEASPAMHCCPLLGGPSQWGLTLGHGAWGRPPRLLPRLLTYAGEVAAGMVTSSAFHPRDKDEHL